MAPEPEQPTPPEQPRPGPGEQPPQEHFGPLQLLRTSKADGRALLLFSHREPKQ